MKRFMIAGTGSGCGKTTVACAVMRAFVNRGMNVASFKCGPDYIDPMFHAKVIGTHAYNLDSVFCDEDTLRFLFDKNSENADISVIEGVMGIYDGMNEKGSSNEISLTVNSPVVLVIDCKGMSTSIGAVMHGFLTYIQPNNIAGFIFNRLPESLVESIKRLCERMNVKFLGYMPNCRNVTIESRHLGLVTATEILDLQEKLDILSEIAEQNIDLDALSELSDGMDFPEYSKPEIKKLDVKTAPKIAVASDKAFSFIYSDNIDILKKLGCKIQYFSPLNDAVLPEDICGIILSGGYPEYHAKRLSENKSMLQAVKNAIDGGMPIIAECGGFMYLHDSLESVKNETFSMVGAISGRAFQTGRLQRFGYINMTAENDNLLCKKGESISAHEFHYWDSTNCGSDFDAEKMSNGKHWSCVHASKSMYAGFPHIYFYSDIELADSFVKECVNYQNEKVK